MIQEYYCYGIKCLVKRTDFPNIYQISYIDRIRMIGEGSYQGMDFSFELSHAIYLAYYSTYRFKASI